MLPFLMEELIIVAGDTANCVGALVYKLGRDRVLF